jgi:hypothetical protein
VRDWITVGGAIAALLAVACAGSNRESIHPDPPPEGRAVPVADPPPSRVTMHVSIFPEALKAQLEASLPPSAEGEVAFLAGKTLKYVWVREPFELKFDRGRVIVTTNVTATVSLLGDRVFKIALRVAGEPIITPDYQAALQSAEVTVAAEGSLDRLNRAIEEKLREQLLTTLENLRLDVRPLLTELYARIVQPIPLPLGYGENGCASMEVAAIEAGPTVLAGGIEKDFGLVVLPSVTMPCARTSTTPPPLPLLANVASIPSGPFTVVLPVAADYLELSKAMDRSINGKLYFSKEYPRLYLEKPQVFSSGESLVIKLMLGGDLEVAGIETALEGELYFAGHPRLVDNQITIPDLELTPGTVDSLLGLKILLDGGSIRDQARAALRLDVSERLNAVKEKLSTELTFKDGLGCARAELLRSEITGIHPHASFLRIYVTINAQGSIYFPCKR